MASQYPGGSGPPSQMPGPSRLTQVIKDTAEVRIIETAIDARYQVPLALPTKVGIPERHHPISSHTIREDVRITETRLDNSMQQSHNPVFAYPHGALTQQLTQQQHLYPVKTQPLFPVHTFVSTPVVPNELIQPQVGARPKKTYNRRSQSAYKPPKIPPEMIIGEEGLTVKQHLQQQQRQAKQRELELKREREAAAALAARLQASDKMPVTLAPTSQRGSKKTPTSTKNQSPPQPVQPKISAIPNINVAAAPAVMDPPIPQAPMQIPLITVTPPPAPHQDQQVVVKSLPAYKAPLTPAPRLQNSLLRHSPEIQRHATSLVERLVDAQHQIQDYQRAKILPANSGAGPSSQSGSSSGAGPSSSSSTTTSQESLNNILSTIEAVARRGKQPLPKHPPKKRSAPKEKYVPPNATQIVSSVPVEQHRLQQQAQRPPPPRAYNNARTKQLCEQEKKMLDMLKLKEPKLPPPLPRQSQTFDSVVERKEHQQKLEAPRKRPPANLKMLTKKVPVPVTPAPPPPMTNPDSVFKVPDADAFRRGKARKSHQRPASDLLAEQERLALIQIQEMGDNLDALLEWFHAGLESANLVSDEMDLLTGLITGNLLGLGFTMEELMANERDEVDDDFEPDPEVVSSFVGNVVGEKHEISLDLENPEAPAEEEQTEPQTEEASWVPPQQVADFSQPAPGYMDSNPVYYSQQNEWSNQSYHYQVPADYNGSGFQEQMVQQTPQPCNYASTQNLEPYPQSAQVFEPKQAPVNDSDIGIETDIISLFETPKDTSYLSPEEQQQHFEKIRECQLADEIMAQYQNKLKEQDAKSPNVSSPGNFGALNQNLDVNTGVWDQVTSSKKTPESSCSELADWEKKQLERFLEVDPEYAQCSPQPQPPAQQNFQPNLQQAQENQYDQQAFMQPQIQQQASLTPQEIEQMTMEQFYNHIQQQFPTINAEMNADITAEQLFGPIEPEPQETPKDQAEMDAIKQNTTTEIDAFMMGSDGGSSPTNLKNDPILADVALEDLRLDSDVLGNCEIFFDNLDLDALEKDDAKAAKEAILQGGTSSLVDPMMEPFPIEAQRILKELCQETQAPPEPQANIPQEKFLQENVPEENVLVENVPVENVPVENVPVENVPEKTFTEENFSQENFPEENYPEENFPEEDSTPEDFPPENFPFTDDLQNLTPEEEEQMLLAQQQEDYERELEESQHYLGLQFEHEEENFLGGFEMDDETAAEFAMFGGAAMQGIPPELLEELEGEDFDPSNISPELALLLENEALLNLQDSEEAAAITDEYIERRYQEIADELNQLPPEEAAAQLDKLRDTVEADREEEYAAKLKELKSNMKSMVYANAALLDEVSRLQQRINVCTEERKILSRRMCHHYRNYIRRLQTAKRRRMETAKRMREELLLANSDAEKVEIKKKYRNQMKEFKMPTLILRKEFKNRLKLNMENPLEARRRVIMAALNKTKTPANRRRGRPCVMRRSRKKPAKPRKPPVALAKGPKKQTVSNRKKKVSFDAFLFEDMFQKKNTSLDRGVRAAAREARSSGLVVTPPKPAAPVVPSEPVFAVPTLPATKSKHPISPKAVLLKKNLAKAAAVTEEQKLEPQPQKTKSVKRKLKFDSEVPSTSGLKKKKVDVKKETPKTKIVKEESNIPPEKPEEESKDSEVPPAKKKPARKRQGAKIPAKAQPAKKKLRKSVQAVEEPPKEVPEKMSEEPKEQPEEEQKVEPVVLPPPKAKRGRKPALQRKEGDPLPKRGRPVKTTRARPIKKAVKVQETVESVEVEAKLEVEPEVEAGVAAEVEAVVEPVPEPSKPEETEPKFEVASEVGKKVPGKRGRKKKLPVLLKSKELTLEPFVVVEEPSPTRRTPNKSAEKSSPTKAASGRRDARKATRDRRGPAAAPRESLNRTAKRRLL
ncbi:unnamed protein product [Caenorhabditis auriculariae]|uniref:Uncharacterized protein n=1 Tax=Caenorhabditis auriculariae TaxID=2777116 RepID=A0A8S1H078_9PELO|nr:unnamed protein product [Caenorhabditis auriculariae]